MKLSELKPPKGAVKKMKRIGCGPGSGHGKTSTRGHKGAKARSGARIPPWTEGGQMPLQRRIPKRGFVSVFRTRYQVVNLDRLAAFSSGATVNRGTLVAAGLVRKASDPVKILGRGELSIPLVVEVDAVSRTAAAAIEKAGGTVRVISRDTQAPAPETGEKK